MKTLSLLCVFFGYLLLISNGVHSHVISLLEIGSYILGIAYALDSIILTMQRGAHIVGKIPSSLISTAYAIKAPLALVHDWEGKLYFLACLLLALGYLLALLYHIFKK